MSNFHVLLCSFFNFNKISHKNLSVLFQLAFWSLNQFAIIKIGQVLCLKRHLIQFKSVSGPMSKLEEAVHVPLISEPELKIFGIIGKLSIIRMYLRKKVLPERWRVERVLARDITVLLYATYVAIICLKTAWVMCIKFGRSADLDIYTMVAM